MFVQETDDTREEEERKRHEKVYVLRALFLQMDGLRYNTTDYTDYTHAQQFLLLSAFFFVFSTLK